jgi:xylulokinase
METVLGLDLGTSAAKAVLVDAAGQVRAGASATYPILEPQPGWAEQDPAAWWDATCRAVRALRAEPDGAILLSSLRGIGLSGQMHGTVVLDRAGQPLRPAIIWADARSAAEAAALTAEFGRDGLAVRLGGPIAPGFMAATLAWLRDHEPRTWSAMASCVLPKDALRLRLTGGAPLTEASDASSTLLLDLQRRDWSGEALARLGLRRGVLPPVREAPDVVGVLSDEAAGALGLPAGVPVIAGGSDQGMAAVGAGVVDPGDLLVSVSTGGQLVAPLDRPLVDPLLRALTLCHVVPGRAFCLAATLSAGLALRWLRENVLGAPPDAAFEALLAGAAALDAGADGLLFLPYLLGERSPHLDPQARGVFCGLALRHGQAHLLRAVLEGVAYSLRDVLDVLLAVGVRPERIVVAGGGMRLPLWRQILAGVLGRPLLPLAQADQSALGAALVAGVSTGVFPDLASACRLAVAYEPPVVPDPSAVASYERPFSLYRQLYPAVQPTLAALSGATHQP